MPIMLDEYDRAPAHLPTPEEWATIHAGEPAEIASMEEVYEDFLLEIQQEHLEADIIDAFVAQGHSLKGARVDMRLDRVVLYIERAHRVVLYIERAHFVVAAHLVTLDDTGIVFTELSLDERVQLGLV